MKSVLYTFIVILVFSLTLGVLIADVSDRFVFLWMVDDLLVVEYVRWNWYMVSEV